MSASRSFVRVMRSADLVAAEGLETQIRVVQLGDETVLVGRLIDGRVVAFAAACPHEMTDLRQATFVDGKVRCPRHNYIYDPHSGENMIPTQVARPGSLWRLHPGYLPTHLVEEHDGWVWVKATPNPAPAGWDPALEEPPPDGARQASSTTPPPEEAPVARPTVEVPPKRLRARLSRDFVLRLPMNAKPAHTWKVEVPGGLLAVVEQRFDPGPPPRQLVRLRSRGLGQGTLRCSFGRPWDLEPEEVRTYIVEVLPME
jgi:nitrite reductase/ring-hydroxylating ferredoxin subunit